jgi:uncharacterized membrane protein
MTKIEGPIGVFVASFDSEDTAERALKAIRGMHTRSLVMDIMEDALVTRDEDGKVHVKESRGPGHAAKVGAAAGALVGLLFPPSIIVTGAIGAAAGGVAGKLSNELMGKHFLGDAGEQIEPGRSAIIVVTEAEHMETLAESVPSALRTFSHTFESANADQIQEWLSSIRTSAEAASEAPSS